MVLSILSEWRKCEGSSKLTMFSTVAAEGTELRKLSVGSRNQTVCSKALISNTCFFQSFTYKGHIYPLLAWCRQTLALRRSLCQSLTRTKQQCNTSDAPQEVQINKSLSLF
ncbi:hypothetical protein ElyMa_004518700 [Elysia marginata]|uniref:Uncharacterized protein n=1 Tax=Elysia marginata TaxID=1093978 RepID=A0AAV4HMD5_9GAST|nr:hypothetical protein ElyMa_004518700 [Elysia marginata]